MLRHLLVICNNRSGSSAQWEHLLDIDWLLSPRSNEVVKSTPYFDSFPCCSVLSERISFQNAIFIRSDFADRLPGSSLGPDSVNQLYLDALSVNWNDLIHNIVATRRGAPMDLIQAEIEQFGAYDEFM